MCVLFIEIGNGKGIAILVFHNVDDISSSPSGVQINMPEFMLCSLVIVAATAIVEILQSKKSTKQK